MKERLDHNIHNPMIVHELNPYPPHLPYVEYLSQETYNLIPIKDPRKIYLISDSNDDRCYLGDILIKNNSVERLYLLGPGDIYGEYSIYLNIKYKNFDKLIEICKYNNPQQAIDALNMFNKVGSHNDTALQIYNILLEYIDKNIGVSDMIIGIISLFGYKNDIRLQKVIGVVNSFNNFNESNTELPLLLRDELPNLANHSFLFKYYHDLYDLLIFYNFFKDEKYQKRKDDDILNLSEIINRIYEIFL